MGEFIMVKIAGRQILELTPLATAPTTPIEGQLYYDSVEKQLRYYDGVEWKNAIVDEGAGAGPTGGTDGPNEFPNQIEATAPAGNPITFRWTNTRGFRHTACPLFLTGDYTRSPVSDVTVKYVRTRDYNSNSSSNEDDRCYISGANFDKGSTTSYLQLSVGRGTTGLLTTPYCMYDGTLLEYTTHYSATIRYTQDATDIANPPSGNYDAWGSLGVITNVVDDNLSTNYSTVSDNTSPLRPIQIVRITLTPAALAIGGNYYRLLVQLEGNDDGASTYNNDILLTVYNNDTANWENTGRISDNDDSTAYIMLARDFKASELINGSNEIFIKAQGQNITGNIKTNRFCEFYLFKGYSSPQD